MKLKKLLASILCVAMVLSTMSFSVFAADATTAYEVGIEKTYATLQDALDAAENAREDKIVINLYQDDTLDASSWQTLAMGADNTTSITINGNNNTLTFNLRDSDWSHVTTNNNAKFILNNINIESSGYNSGHWKRYGVHFACETEMNNVTSDVMLGFKANANLNNVTITESKAGYSIWLWACGQKVTIDGLTVKTSTGRGIKIGDEDADEQAVKLSLSNATFSTAEKSAILVSSAYGADITVGNVDISGVAADSTNLVWVDEDSNEYYNKVQVSGGTVAAEGVDTAPIEVASKDELNKAISDAKNGQTIKLTANIEADQITIEKAVTLDLGRNTLTTTSGWGGLLLKGGASLVNGNLSHTGNTAAIKLWDAREISDVTITVAFTEGKTKGGIVIQSDSVGVDVIKNVTISGDGLTNGIETYNCGKAAELVIGSMNNVTIDAVGTAMNISAPCGTATDCTFSGDVTGIELWIKGTYSATLELVDCDVAGGSKAVYVHDEFNSNPDIENIGTLSLTVDEETTFESENGSVFTMTIARAENVNIDEQLLAYAVAENGKSKYSSFADALADAKDGDTITIFAGEYEGFDVPANKNNLTFVGETDADGNNLVTIKTLDTGIESHNGGIFVGAENTTFKNLNFTAGTTPGASSGWMSSSLGNTNGDTGMSSSLKNLTVENCNFTGSGAYQAIWTNQGNVTVKNSTITKYDTAVDTYGIHADQKMVIENTEIADVRNAFHTGEAEVGSQIDVTETTIDSDVIDIGGAAAVTITNSEISNAVVTTYTENNQMTISGTLLINSVINEEAKGRYNGVNIAEDYDAAIAAVAENNEIISTKLNISFEQVEAGLYNIVLNGEDDIYEFVGAELTFKNESTTFGNEYMNYEILGIGGKTNAEKSIEKADTYALRLVDGAERMSGRDLVIGQVKFYGQGNINFTVSEGTVVTTEYGTNLGQYYTLDADDTTADTLTVDAIANGAVEEVTRTVVVNVAYNHALDGTYWNDNQITVTLKDGFGNVYDPEDLTNGVATINNVKLGRLTVTLEAPGFRKYVYNTTLEAGADENDALVLNFWNNVKRNEELNGVVVEPLAEIETGKGFMAHNFVVGDIVMDYTVDEYDLAAVTSYYGMYGLEDADKYIKYDLNRDGNIDIIDVHYVLHTLNN